MTSASSGRERKDTKVALKLEHRKQLGLKCSVSGAPMFLETVALLPLLAIGGSSEGDLGQVIQLEFSLVKGGRSGGERAPGRLELSLKLLKLRGRRRKSFIWKRLRSPNSLLNLGVS